MGFSTLIYLFFLLLTASGYYLIKGKYRWIWLLAASLGYYFSFIPVFLPLLVLIVTVNYFLALGLSRSDSVRSLRLGIIIVINVLILAFFKYFNTFFQDLRINLYAVDFFFRTDPVNKMIFPLGLSYLIFTLISYHIELKRKNIQHEKHPAYFALYLTFFPRIAQGPIERPQALLPQLRKIQPFDAEMVADGLKLMLWGYFKKLVVADRLAIYVNAVYGNYDQHNGTTLALATFFYAIQIYADFSGYTDIALGSAKLFGINLTENFKRPYFAISIKEFWNRWHMTLSTWLRDYLFLPLAFWFSKRMKKPYYLGLATEKWIYMMAIMITFAICGVWHGEGWNYLSWGLLFGVFLTWSNWTGRFIRRMHKRFGVKKESPVNMAIQIVLTFLLVAFSWIFFRSNNMGQAFSIIQKLLTMHGPLFIGEWQTIIYSLFGISILFIVEFSEEFGLMKKWIHLYDRWYIQQFVWFCMIMIILTIGVFDGGQFIYFQF